MQLRDLQFFCALGRRSRLPFTDLQSEIVIEANSYDLSQGFPSKLLTVTNPLLMSHKPAFKVSICSNSMEYFHSAQ